MLKPVIGLEVHIQLTGLRTKLFCSCSSDYRNTPPNTNVCPVCLGLPGSLPVVNEKAVEQAVKLCLAIRGKTARKLVFDRKHYFYPDLPKNYQITQYLEPICRGGYIEVEEKGKQKKIRIKRINIEEDPGRIVYPTGSILTSPYTLVDYNRSGIALLEIVTEPDITSPSEAQSFLEELKTLLEHLEICDCSLEGAMRVDANISLPGGERVEVKNIGSITDVKKALTYEIVRQQTLIARGEKVKRETRHWDSTRKITIPGRAKEVEEDYRYMPDPNLPPITIPRRLVEEISSKMPELPRERAERIAKQYTIPLTAARIIVRKSKKLADFYEKAASQNPEKAKWIANYIINDLLGWLGEKLEELNKINPATIARLAEAVDKGLITIRQAKEAAREIARGKSLEEIIARKNYQRLADRKQLEKIVEQVLQKHPKAVRDAATKPRAVDFLVGMVMKETRGRADPKLARRIVLEKLEKHKTTNTSPKQEA